MTHRTGSAAVDFRYRSLTAHCEFWLLEAVPLYPYLGESDLPVLRHAQHPVAGVVGLTGMKLSGISNLAPLSFHA